MLSKRLIFFFAALIFFFIGTIIVLFVSRTAPVPKQIKPSSVSETQNKKPTISQDKLEIISSNPESGAKQVPLSLKTIILRANKEVGNAHIKSLLVQESDNWVIGTNARIRQSTIYIDILKILDPDTTYNLSVSSNVGKIYDMSFTTEESAEPIDTYPSGFRESVESALIKKRPDIFLMTKLPYSTNTFNMKYVREQGKKIRFQAFSEILNENQLKTAVASWLIGIGLSNSAIDLLNIEYYPKK